MGSALRYRLSLLAVAVAMVMSLGAKAQEKADVAPNRPPLLLYVATGEANACGDGCSEWIAAEGAFDPGAAQRVRAFVRRLPGPKLPIFFQSIGGIQTEALAVGRFLREQGMTAGVAKTIPQTCPAADKDEDCRSLKRSGQKLAAEFRSIDASCNSACVYALIGASVRDVPPGAHLGVHSSKFVRIFPDGHVNVPSLARLSVGEKARMMEANAEVRRYVHDMGIDAGLFDAAMKVSPDQVHYLSRNEIAQFGIDTKDFEESRWSLLALPSQPVSVFKFITQARGAGKKDFRASAIQLVCAGPTRIKIGYFRGLGSDEAADPRAITISAGERNFALPRTARTSKIDVIDTGAQFEVRVGYAGIEFFQTAAAGKSIDITEAPVAPAEHTQVITLSVAGLSHAISVLGQHCGGGGNPRGG